MKIWKRFIVLGFVFGLLLIGSTVCAETLPVKNAWILDEDCVVVLREDGNLLIANSIDAETPELVFENVSDFYGSVHNGYMSGVVLFKNGDVATIDYNYEITIVANNAKEIYSLPYFQYAYIDNNNVLRGKHSYVNTDNTVIMKNVKKCYGFYLITNDNQLYQLSYGSSTENFTERKIMDNISEITAFYDNLFALRTNGDLYYIKDSETPVRIGTNIESIDKVKGYHEFAGGFAVEYINNKNEYYWYHSEEGLEKQFDNIKDIYFTAYQSRWVLDSNNNLFYLGNYVYEPSTVQPRFESSNIQRMIEGTTRIAINTDNALCSLDEENGYRNVILADVKDVILEEGPSYKEGCYFYITNSGELYGAFSHDKPFLTSFCQKQTKVLINQQEIELTAKIQMVDNRSMYPFRECLENMGATVMWDSVNEIAIGEYGKTTIEFPIGKKEYYINGVRHEMDTASYVDESIGRTYIPIRYAAEGLGFTVDWIEGDSENTISIHK